MSPADSENRRPGLAPSVVVTWTAVVVVTTVILATVPLLLLDPRADDGAAPMVAIIGFPLVATAIVIEICRHQRNLQRGVPRTVLIWLLGVMPAGLLALVGPAMLAEPEYFTAETPGGFIRTLFGMLALIAIAILLGGLVWFFVLFPLSAIVTQVGAAIRGKGFHPGALVVPLLMLAVPAIAIVAALALDGLAPGRAAGSQFLFALLGIPAGYDVVWPTGLWIVRGLVLGAILVAVAAWWRARKVPSD